MIKKLKAMHGAVSPLDVMMRRLFTLSQGKNEHISAFATRLETAINERSRLALKSSETGELSCDSLNLTGFISRYNVKNGRTHSSHQVGKKGLREQLSGTEDI